MEKSKRIISINIDEKIINILHNNKGLILRNFFQTDSIHVLLGKNGSGKTHYLTEIAKLFSGRIFLGTAILENSLGEIRALENGEHEDFGILYFTPLPYRKKIKPSRRVLDISPSSRGGKWKRDTKIFQQVCDILKINTKLACKISYRPSIFSSYLAPCILEYSENKPSNNYLSSTTIDLINEYKHVSSSGETQENQIRVKSKIKRDMADIIQEYVLSQDKEPQEIITELATLQKMFSTYRNREEIAYNYLHHIEFFDNPYRKPTDEVHHRFTSTIERTRDIINISYNVNIEDNGIDFPYDEKLAELEWLLPGSAVDVGWENLSSGMQALVDQFSQIHSGITKLADINLQNILILIDEGDAYLHLDWQRRYIELLDKFLGERKKAMGIDSIQVLIATHSPVITSDFPSSMITSLDNNDHLDKTFATPIENIIFHNFDSSSIGSHAIEKIKQLRQKIISKTLSSEDRLLINEIGDVMIKKALTGQ